jgi:hypothetical protein
MMAMMARVMKRALRAALRRRIMYIPNTEAATRLGRPVNA